MCVCVCVGNGLDKRVAGCSILLEPVFSESQQENGPGHFEQRAYRKLGMSVMDEGGPEGRCDDSETCSHRKMSSAQGYSWVQVGGT